MERLMSAADLERVTGMKRFSNQVEWFRREFSVNVARCGDGSPVMTWLTFEALQQKKAGLTAEPSKQERTPLRSSTLRSVK